MGCDKITHRCGKKQNAVCVSYESGIPNFSNLNGQECVSIEETTNDTYSIISNIKSEINVSSLDLECLSVSSLTLKTLLQALISECCDLKQTTETQAITITTMAQQIEDLQSNNCP